MDLAEILKNWEANPGADPESIKKAEASLGLTLPDDYRQFLTRANGGVGNIGSNYLDLYRVEDLKQLNEQYEVFQYVPGVLLIGSSGGGDAYAFDLRTSPWSVGEVPFIGMDLEYLEPIATSFSRFLERLTHDE